MCYPSNDVPFGCACGCIMNGHGHGGPRNGNAGTGCGADSTGMCSLAVVGTSQSTVFQSLLQDIRGSCHAICLQTNIFLNHIGGFLVDFMSFFFFFFLVGLMI